MLRRHPRVSLYAGTGMYHWLIIHPALILQFTKNISTLAVLRWSCRWRRRMFRCWTFFCWWQNSWNRLVGGLIVGKSFTAAAVGWIVIPAPNIRVPVPADLWHLLYHDAKNLLDLGNYPPQSWGTLLWWSLLLISDLIFCTCAIDGLSRPRRNARSQRKTFERNARTQRTNLLDVSFNKLKMAAKVLLLCFCSV